MRGYEETELSNLVDIHKDMKLCGYIYSFVLAQMIIAAFSLNICANMLV